MSLLRHALAAACLCALTACTAPVEVTETGQGLTKLTLAGKPGQVLTLSKAVSTQGHVVPKGTRWRVRETWLIRRTAGPSAARGQAGAAQRGYRVPGYYDPAAASAGFVLPAGSVTSFYVAVPEIPQKRSTAPGQKAVQLVVPAEAAVF